MTFSGYYSIAPLLSGSHAELTYLLWPVLPPPRYAGDTVAPWVRLFELYQQPQTHPGLPLIVTALGVFVALRVRAYLSLPPAADT